VTPTSATLDVDANGVLDPLMDGVLIARYFFGFRGPALISDAVGEDCDRCTAGEIEDYLDEIRPVLDIDFDGEIEPLEDGLLILRHLFGVSGAPLVSGAVDLTDCTRCTAEEIETYLDGLP
jgi:hypothetical protein